MNILSPTRFSVTLPSDRDSGSPPAQTDELIVLDKASVLSLIALARAAASSLELRLDPSALEMAVLGEHQVEPSLPGHRRTSAARASEIYRFRRRREAMLGADLFGEPVWDLVLDLFAAQAEGRQTCVSSACIGAAVPSTTALRWIKELEARGIVQREHDPADARRTFLALSPAFFEKMAAVLEV